MTLKERLEMLITDELPVYSNFTDQVDIPHYPVEADLVRIWHKLTPEIITYPKLTFSFSRPLFSVKLLREIEHHEFYARHANADVHKFLKSSGESIEIYKSIRTGQGYQTNVQAVSKSLSLLHPSIFKLLEAVMIEPSSNPDDEYWRHKYRDPYFHSYMVAGIDGIVHVFPTPIPEIQDTTDACLAHEMGHVLSLKFWSEQLDHPGWKNYIKATKSDRIRPSNYARQSPHEDFAETFRLYVLYDRLEKYKNLQHLFPARFDIIGNLLDSIP